MDLQNWSWLLRCPVCRGRLSFEPVRCVCDDCGETFPVNFGFPDFRLSCPSDAGYMTKEEDLSVSDELFRLHDELSFEELARIKIREESGNLDQNIQDHYIKWRTDNRARAMQLVEWIKDQGISGPDSENRTVGLDIGCGSGCGVATLLEVADTAVGFGLAISDLLLARKFLEESYPDRDYLLLTGIGEQMALASDSFSYVLARDVIEHVADPQEVLKETHRVMRSGGFLLFNTGSRFVFLEPHTRLPAVGYIPRFLHSLYFRLGRKIDFKVHLPSLWELRRWLKQSLFDDSNWEIFPSKSVESTIQPRVKDGKGKRLILGLLNRLGISKVMNWILAQISYYEVIIKK